MTLAPKYSSVDPQADRPVVAVAPAQPREGFKKTVLRNGIGAVVAVSSVPVRWGSHPQDQVKMEEAIAAVVEVFGITRRDLLGRARPEWVIRGRLALYRLAWVHVGCSQAELGRLLGKSTGTIRLGMFAALNRIETDAKYRAQYEKALDLLDPKDQ